MVVVYEVKNSTDNVNHNANIIIYALVSYVSVV